MLRTRTAAATIAATAFAAAVGCAALVQAQAPAPPTFGYLFGQVTVEGENIAPETQPVIAFVNGVSCGSAQTFIAIEGDEVPPADVGRTVYVIDVFADGARNYERPGCGHPGD
ncbi:MAG: hypothetical protein ACRDHY_14465, partial [Anaerolineales bacterium]